MTPFGRVLEDAFRAASHPLGEDPALFARSVRAFSDLNDVRGEPTPKPRPFWAVELGVDFPCDEPTVRRAFRRLARTTHPDCPGGSHEAFLDAQRIFEEALAAVHDATVKPGRSRPTRAPAPSVYV